MFCNYNIYSGIYFRFYMEMLWLFVFPLSSSISPSPFLSLSLSLSLPLSLFLSVPCSTLVSLLFQFTVIFMLFALLFQLRSARLLLLVSTTIYDNLLHIQFEIYYWQNSQCVLCAYISMEFMKFVYTFVCMCVSCGYWINFASN